MTLLPSLLARVGCRATMGMQVRPDWVDGGQGPRTSDMPFMIS